MKHKIGIAVCIILLILTIGFTWNNSRKTVAQSQAESQTVSDKIQTVVNKAEHNEQTTTAPNAVVQKLRKAAHLIEFFAIGIELSALSFVLKKRFLPQSLWNILSSAIVIAVIDESIQILSGRGASVKDILLDFSGAVAGFLIALFVRFVITSCKGKGRKKYAKN